MNHFIFFGDFFVKKKHIYLNLFNIDFPLTAITSIIHRITGLFLFLSFPFVLYFFKLSFESINSFLIAEEILSRFYIKYFFFFIFFSFVYHMFFGIKHIIMDFGFFIDKKYSSIIALFFIFLVLFTIFLSVLL